MKVVYSDALSFRSLVQTISSLVDEAAFTFDRDGVVVVAMDPAHVSMITVKLGTVFFSSYDVAEKFVFGFNTQYLLRLLKFLRKGDALEISSDPSGLVILNVNGKVPRRFLLRNLSVSSPNLPQLKMEFDVRAVVSSEALFRAIDQASAVSDAVTFTVDESSLRIVAGEENALEVELSKDMGALREVSMKKKSTASYSLDYLNGITGLGRMSKEVELQFSEEKPLQLNFPVDGGNVTYLLAPKLS
ncbi:DNA polymerase III sliding clamp [Sulfodiicoccus acidiphilus]|uniref:DNA polymerase sliding clamp n=1 Tax=Sulfodiicoccus acidiphilus TaxID=1670455 RepID=A0A348B189_9CREN|nr:DNA polymerase sliding clamp [Sulfodiicoccus acidiphilus]BBD71941.1 DNA polymerase III sliding clamp [Sulfodiicoccus acidiphilus]GGT91626.1 DNA polymerase III sliding clamp [Sulfodiicoccus acidiphilus]